MPNTREGYCALCAYIKSHPVRLKINKRLYVDGVSYASIAKETGLDQRTVAKHVKLQHGAKRVLDQVANIREVKEALDLEKCKKEIYDKSIKAANMALGEVDTPATANLSVFGQCIAPATKIVEVMAKIDDKPEVTQINTTNVSDLSKLSIDQLKALKEMKTTVSTDTND